MSVGGEVECLVVEVDEGLAQTLVELVQSGAFDEDAGDEYDEEEGEEDEDDDGE